MALAVPVIGFIWRHENTRLTVLTQLTGLVCLLYSYASAYASASLFGFSI